MLSSKQSCICFCDISEKEESFFNKGDVRGYITQGGKDQMVVMPGIPPTTGIKGNY